MSKLCILLSNDDGYDAPGICALEEALSEIGEVWKIAPDQQRSGMSHALNFHGSVSLEQFSKRCYLLKDGYPADCVNVGLYAKGFPPFDLVVSGINHGPNLGDDVHYSGTVAAARQATIHHIRSIAVSAVDAGASASQMLRIAKWTRNWLEKKFSLLETRITYNINYPIESDTSGKRSNSYPPVYFSSQGQRIYKDKYEEKKNESTDEKKNSKRILKLALTELGYVPEKGSDFEVTLRDKCISITPLSTYTTAIQELEKWQRKK